MLRKFYILFARINHLAIKKSMNEFFELAF